MAHDWWNAGEVVGEGVGSAVEDVGEISNSVSEKSWSRRSSGRNEQEPSVSKRTRHKTSYNSPKLVAAVKRNPDGIGSQKPNRDKLGWDD